MPGNIIAINANSSETRVALIEAGSLAEILIERNCARGYLGNIYKAKVTRVLPGMQAAFVELGEERAAFLYAGDISNEPELERRQRLILQDPTKDFSDLREDTSQIPIEKLIKQGQQITVQVIKEPISTKGARVTMFMSIPGRYLVLMPKFNHVGISRRIEDDGLRTRLKSLIDSIKPPDCGVIIRTAATQATDDLLKRDLEYLLHTWNRISVNIAESRAPKLLFREADIHIKALRDLYNDSIDRIVIDNREVFDELTEFLRITIPSAVSKLELYQKTDPLFDQLGIEVDIARALSRKVWLPSGGYLIVEQTEALTAFDVNTGKFVGKLSARETILKTNLEAVRVIASQLRLRNIGGIIVIDFIDMDFPEDQDRVYSAFDDALKHDKAKANILRISELGLIQMTRKRTSDSLERILTDECPHCDGLGVVKSSMTNCLDLLRDLQRHCIQMKPKAVSISLRGDLKDLLSKQHADLFEEICLRFKIQVELRVSKNSGSDPNAPAYEIT